MLDSNQNQQEVMSPYLEREGARYSRTIAKAVQQVPWHLKSLQLIWTAGPVTYIALQGGYYLGYGKLAPWQIFVYFAGYTLIAGLVGIIATVGYHIFQKPKEIVASKALNNAISRLISLLAFVKNHKLKDLDIEYRKLETARLILENSHAEPLAIKLAIENITNDTLLAEKAAEIEVYRRLGLQARVADTVTEIQDRIQNIVDTMTIDNPHLADLIQLRLIGKAPSLQQGLARNPYFIRRLLLANEEENELLITPRDIEEILILTLELLAGREFAVFNVKYKGKKRVAQTLEKLESARKGYQLALTSCRSRVKALYVFLATLEKSEVEFVAFGLPLEEQIKQIKIGVDNLYHSLRVQLQDKSYRVRLKKKSFLDEFKKYKRALNLYKKSYEQIKKIRYKKNILSNALKDWERIKRYEKNTLMFDSNKMGFKVFEETIHLQDKEKIFVVEKINEYLESHSDSIHDYENYHIEDYKRLAIEVALILSDYLPLDNPIVQYAIESSDAANMHSIEPGASSKTNVGYLTAVVYEVDDSNMRVTEGLIKALVEIYGITLNNQVIELLEDTFDIDAKRIRKIEKEATKQEARPLDMEYFDETLLVPPARYWNKLINVIDSKLN